MVLYDFARTSPDRMAALYGAYGEAGGPGRVRTPTDFSLLIAQLGHIGAMQMRRWLDPATSATERTSTHSPAMAECSAEWVVVTVRDTSPGRLR